MTHEPGQLVSVQAAFRTKYHSDVTPSTERHEREERLTARIEYEAQQSLLVRQIVDHDFRPKLRQPRAAGLLERRRHSRPYLRRERLTLPTRRHAERPLKMNGL